MATGLVSWGLSLIFQQHPGARNCQERPGNKLSGHRGRSLLGQCNGTVWALGLSSSAALVMATPSSIPAALLKISGVISLSQTIYTWQSGATAAILMASSITIALLSAPASSTKDAESFGVTGGLEVKTLEARRTPAEWLEYAPALSVAVAILGLAYVARIVMAKGLLAALDLYTYNLLFLMTGLLLHWRPRSFVRAVNDAVPATAGSLDPNSHSTEEFFGIVTMSSLAGSLAHFFVSVSSTSTFPVLVSIYSGVLGMFVPSGGSKWIIEAPYVLQAAKDLHVNLGWVVQIYNTSEALPNLINPFWMLPLLGLLKVKARDLIGYGLLYFMVNSVLVLFLMWFFARTFAYVPPLIP